jgi:hypothetical protein
VITVIMIGKSKVGKVTPKPNNTYPFVRLPQECTDVIGQSFAIYDTEYKGKRAFLLVMGDESPKVIQQKIKSTIEKRMDSLENKIDQVFELINTNQKQNESELIWARRDSNTRSSPCEGDVIAN